MTREKKLEEAVSLAARIFRTYEDLHRSKTPPAESKAKENAALARKMEAALAYEEPYQKVKAKDCGCDSKSICSSCNPDEFYKELDTQNSKE